MLPSGKICLIIYIDLQSLIDACLVKNYIMLMQIPAANMMLSLLAISALMFDTRAQGLNRIELLKVKEQSFKNCPVAVQLRIVFNGSLVD